MNSVNANATAHGWAEATLAGKAWASNLLAECARTAMDHGWRPGDNKTPWQHMHDEIIKCEETIHEAIHRLKAHRIEADGLNWTPAQGVEKLAATALRLALNHEHAVSGRYARERLTALEEWLEGVSEAATAHSNATVNQGTPESGEASGFTSGQASAYASVLDALREGIPTPEPDKWAVGTRVLARTDYTVKAGTAGRIIEHGYGHPTSITIQWEGEHPSAATFDRRAADDRLFVIPPAPEQV